VTTTGSARDRILDAAERLILEHGFTATSLDAILSAADASKGAFFHHFDGKEALGRAVVTRYADRDRQLLEEFMGEAETESEDPGEQVVAFVRRFEEAADEISYVQPGCLFVSFIYERGPHVDAEDDVIVDSIELWRARILDKLQKAAATRPRLQEVDLEALADQVFTTFEGGFILARATREPSHLRRQIAQLRHYLELLIVP
jgi:TetR/AcrR family transcriptional repressor of nem operon